MRKLLIVILLFISFISYGQENNVALKFNGATINFSRNLVYQNTLAIGQVLNLKASSISEDLLTYNSSGDLVTYSNIDTVVLDGSSEVVIGNSVRFGTPTSGIIYQILDTLGSSDSLILDQSFTGSITDEFYWGGINIWNDESGNNNNVTQNIGVRQAKLLYYNTDSVKVHNNGIGKMGLTTILNDMTEWGISMNVDYYSTLDKSFNFIIGGIGNKNLLTKSDDFNIGYRADNAAYYSWNGTGNTILTSVSDLLDNNEHFFSFSSDGVNIHLALDGIYKGFITPPSTFIYISKILEGYTNSTFTPKYSTSRIIIYDRSLSLKELKILSK